jgi:hypothetical protein
MYFFVSGRHRCVIHLVLIQNLERNELPRDLVVAKFLNFSNPTRCDPCPWAYRVEEKIKVSHG